MIPTTTHVTNRDDLLSIGEVQIGFRWVGRWQERQAWVPTISIALEGQIWNGAGNATTTEGNLGFFGFSTGVGLKH